MPSFTEILNKKIDDIEAPKNMPTGTYLWSITSLPKTSEIAEGKYDVVDYELNCLGAQDDVDAAALAAYGNVLGKKIRHRFMFDKLDTTNFDRNLYFWKIFNENTLGIKEDSIKETLNAAVGKQLYAKIRWRHDTRLDRTFDEIGDTAKVD